MFKKYIKYKKKYLNITQNIGGAETSNKTTIYLNNFAGDEIGQVNYDVEDTITKIMTSIFEQIDKSMPYNRDTFKISYNDKIICNYLMEFVNTLLENTIKSLLPGKYAFYIHYITDNTGSINKFSKIYEDLKLTRLDKYRTYYNEQSDDWYNNEWDNDNNIILNKIFSNFTLTYTNYVFYYTKYILYIIDAISNTIEPYKLETIIIMVEQISNNRLLYYIIKLIGSSIYIHLKYLNSLNYNIVATIVPKNNVARLLLYIYDQNISTLSYNNLTHLYNDNYKDIILAYVKAGGDIKDLIYNHKDLSDQEKIELKYILITTIIPQDNDPINIENAINYEIILNLCKTGECEDLYSLLWDTTEERFLYVLNDYLIVTLIISMFWKNYLLHIDLQIMEINKIFNECQSFGNTTINRDRLTRNITKILAQEYLTELKNTRRFNDWVSVDRV